MFLFLSDRTMSNVLLDGLDPRTTREHVENYCQSYGRILNCYVKPPQCTVTFAQREPAEEFVRSSPHRLDVHSVTTARWKTSLQPSLDQCRLRVDASKDQLNEKSLFDYFSHFGPVRMCQVFAQDECATITFDRKQSCDDVLKQPRHFLHGRSISVEIASETNRKRPRPTSPVKTKEDPSVIQWYEQEKQQWQEQMLRLQHEHQQKIGHYQTLLREMANEVVKKENEMEKLKKENRDIE